MALIVVAMGMIFCCGGVVGFLLTSQVTGKIWLVPVALGAVLLLGLVSRIAMKRFDAVLDATVRRRVSLIHGATAEVYVSCLLRDQLPDTWHLFDNLKLDDRSDIDHVLVGPGGFFVISTKSQRGWFRLPPKETQATFNGEPNGWASDATRQALRLRDQVAVVAPDLPAPWLQTIVALPFAHIDAPPALAPDGTRLNRALPNCSIPGVGTCWVLNDDDLLGAIAPYPLPVSRKLNLADVDRWAAALQTLHARHRSASAASESY